MLGVVLLLLQRGEVFDRFEVGKSIGDSRQGSTLCVIYLMEGVGQGKTT